MMKLLALQNATRRSNSLRAAAVIDGIVDGGAKSPATLFWLVLHGLCCLISLLLGFRFSRLVLFILFSSASPNSSTMSATSTISRFDVSLTVPFLTTPKDAGVVYTGIGGSDSSANKTIVNGGVSGSRVVVGRHGIRIRPWPHPNPEEVMKAHRILERVQREQRLQYGVKNPRNLIVVTPTFSRTFQALHLTSVMHSLMNAPYDVVWIVVEAGGVTNETASLIGKSGIQTLHTGFNRRMPITWADRHKMEDQMRLRALRVVRAKKLDGVVIFADDSNMHSMELFDEVQKVNWIGAVSVGILIHSGGDGETLRLEKMTDEENSLFVQGPACNSSEVWVGWHTSNLSSYAEKSAVFIGDTGIVLPRKLEWAGFVLNSRLLWKYAVDKPEWVNDLDMFGGGNIESPLSLIKDPSVIEPLGSCGRKVLLWWLRVEARSDSKFPPRWIIDKPLEVTVPAKRSPWPDAPPELPTNSPPVLPTNTKVMTVEENSEKRHSKNRTSRSKRSSRGRKHGVRSTETQVSSRQTGEN